MAEAAADIGRAAHLPEQPGQALGARGALLRQELAELLGEVHEDRAGLEDADRLRAAAVDHRRDLGIRVDRDEAAAELVALADPDQPGVVFGALVALRQQLLEHDRDLDAVRRALRIELQRVLADRQFLLVLRAGGRAVDVGEAAHRLLGLFQDQTLGGVYSGIGHQRLHCVGRVSVAQPAILRGHFGGLRPARRRASPALRGRCVIARRRASGGAISGRCAPSG